MLVAIIAIVGSTIGRELIAGEPVGLVSFALIHFAGYLFFLLMPVEILVPLYLAEGHPGLVLIGLSVGTGLLAQTIDYAIGWVVSDRVVATLLSREKFEKFKATFQKWGGWAIFTFNLLPLSSPNMLLVSGIMRYNRCWCSSFPAVSDELANRLGLSPSEGLADVVARRFRSLPVIFSPDRPILHGRKECLASIQGPVPMFRIEK